MVRSDPEPVLVDLTGNVSGRSIWQNGSALEALGESYPAYRCAGSAGANASALWIMDRFEELGLACHLEKYRFIGWDLRHSPRMEVVLPNGTGQDRRTMPSFQAEHFSYPSGGEGTLWEMTLLPLPLVSSYEAFVGMGYDASLWRGIEIHDKVVLVGREVRWNPAWEAALAGKMEENPAALVFYYSQDWTSAWDVMFMASSGGRPLSTLGSYLHDHEVPSGNLDVNDSKWLLDMMEEGGVSAQVIIPASSGVWEQSNVVAEIPGEIGTEETILLTAHYDSVMGPGFIDNAVGVASLLELASILIQARSSAMLNQAPTFLFVAFNGEEQGLAGSLSYFADHMDELSHVRAVINIDCIGAGTVTFTATETDNGLDLDEVFNATAAKLDMTALTLPGGSDQESFLHPDVIFNSLRFNWGMSPSPPIQMSPLLRSIGISSNPLTLRDALGSGQAGWIHTSRDSSAFANYSDWVSEQNLEQQAELVLRVCIDMVEVDDEAPKSDLLPAIFLVAALATVAIIAYKLYIGRKPPMQ